MKPVKVKYAPEFEKDLETLRSSASDNKFSLSNKQKTALEWMLNA